MRGCSAAKETKPPYGEVLQGCEPLCNAHEERFRFHIDSIVREEDERSPMASRSFSL